jgi:hypothetical protein
MQESLHAACKNCMSRQSSVDWSARLGVHTCFCCLIPPPLRLACCLHFDKIVCTQMHLP